MIPEALASKQALGRALEEKADYFLDEHILGTVWLALSLPKPLLLEGEAGCGKTDLAKNLARVLDTELVRLQCRAEMSTQDMFFQWDREIQDRYIQLSRDKTIEELFREIYSERFIQAGALLRAIRSTNKCVVLIDEIDKASERCEQALLEWLQEFTISDGILGTIHPTSKPYVIITANNMRPLSDPLKGRCCYLYFDYCTVEREAEIVRRKSRCSDQLANQVAYLCRSFREIGFSKPPSIREALDIIEALKVLGVESIDQEVIMIILNLAVKNQADLMRARRKLPELYYNVASMHCKSAEAETREEKYVQ